MLYRKEFVQSRKVCMDQEGWLHYASLILRDNWSQTLPAL